MLSEKLFTALPGYVIISPEKLSTTLNIEQKDGANLTPKTGRVVSLGAPWLTEFGAVVVCHVKVGDRVTHTPRYEEIKIDGELFRIVQFKDIMVKYGK